MTTIDDKPLSQIELNSFVSLERAAELQGVSIDTVKRRMPDKIVALSERRLGMRLKDALQLDAKPWRPGSGTAEQIAIAANARAAKKPKAKQAAKAARKRKAA